MPLPRAYWVSEPPLPPTIEELAEALAYIEGEFRLADGKITGEMWAEGLAETQHRGIRLGRDGKSYYTPLVREMKGQLSAKEWQEIADRAQYLRNRM